MISISSLFSVSTLSEIYALCLRVARSKALDTTSWRTGDPEPSYFYALSTLLSSWETIISGFIQSGFISTSERDWKTLHAYEVYNVTRDEATYATPTVTIDNTGGGEYPIAAGDFRVLCSATKVTFTSTADFSIGPLETGVEVPLIADVAGAEGTVSADEIDEIVTTYDGLEIVSSTAAIGYDEQGDDELEEECADSLGALSPNGPADAFAYVAKKSEITGTSEVTRAKAVADSGTGEVLVYVSGSAGVVSEAAKTLVQTAIDLLCEPLTTTATVAHGTPVTYDYTVTISANDLPTGYEATIQARQAALLEGIDFAGKLSNSALQSDVQVYLEDGGASEVEVTVSQATVTLGAYEFPVLGTCTVVVV